MAVHAVAELDFIKAKVEFALKFQAVVPEITDNETLDLVDARHPLLEESLRNISTRRHIDAKPDKKSSPPYEGGVVAASADGAVLSSANDHHSTSAIVPSSFSLTKQNSVMIISGANAGGKTVVLKTAGLLSLMAISGLPVPAT